MAASQGNPLCSILSSKHAPRVVQPPYTNALAHTSTRTYAHAPAHTSTRTYAHAPALPVLRVCVPINFDYFPTLTMLPQGCEDLLILTTDRPLCLRLTGMPTPPKCRPGANMAPINNPRIQYHQYCSSSMKLLTNIQQYCSDNMPSGFLGG